MTNGHRKMMGYGSVLGMGRCGFVRLAAVNYGECRRSVREWMGDGARLIIVIAGLI